MGIGDVASPLPGETGSHNRGNESYSSYFYSMLCSLAKTLLSLLLCTEHSERTQVRLRRRMDIKYGENDRTSTEITII